jgi:hypothetical protein
MADDDFGIATSPELDDQEVTTIRWLTNLQLEREKNERAVENDEKQFEQTIDQVRDVRRGNKIIKSMQSVSSLHQMVKYVQEGG